MPSEYDALLEAPDTRKPSEYDALLAPASQEQIPSLQTQVIKPQLGLAEMLFDPETAQNLRGSIQDVAYSIPGMAVQIPKMAYEGLKFAAGGPEEQSHVAEEALTQAKIQGDQMAADLQSPLGSRESFRGMANLGLMAAPAIGEALGELALLGRAKPVTEIPEITVPEPAAEIVKPPVQDRQLRIIPERRFTMNEPQPTEAEITAANKELAPVTEPPSATAEPFPSISRSAEDQRRAELQQQPSQVRQAISLDELRLMRERNDLQLQNDLSRRATGTTHPAVDERLGQIDEELTKIANRELQTEGGGEIPSATQERQIPESGQPEYQGNGAGGPPAEAGGGGSTVPGEEVAGTQEVATKAEPQPPAATAPEVPPVEGTPALEVAKPPVQTEPSGISTERLQETYGDDAVLITKGKGAQAWQKIGQADKRDPYAVLSEARKQGIAAPKDVALLRAEHQRLLDAAREAYGTDRYNELAKNAVDFANATKTVAHGPASDVMRALQDADTPRYDSAADFDNIMRERLNRESTPVEKKTFQDITDQVKNGDSEAKQSADIAQKRLAKFREKDVMKFEDAADFVKTQIKELTKDCVL